MAVDRQGRAAVGNSEANAGAVIGDAADGAPAAAAAACSGVITGVEPSSEVTSVGSEICWGSGTGRPGT